MVLCTPHQTRNMSYKKEVTIEDFIDLYGNKLPQRVEVVTGMYHGNEEDDDVSMMTGDVYDMHFVRERKTVKLCASSGEMYQLPLNSLFKIALVHGSSTIPVTCSTVAEILQLNPMPKVMCANTSYITSSPLSSIAAGELLTFSAPLAATGKATSLRVYSITCKQEKLLDLQCTGDFSTDVTRRSVNLTDALSHIEGLFPSEVLISQSSPLLPQALCNKTATLVGLSVMKTVVATLHGAEGDMVIEIPSDSEAEVRVLELKEESRERFLAQHSELLAAYDETQVKFRKNSADPKQMIRGQGHLFNAVATRFKEPAMRRQLKLLPEIKIGSQIDLREENKSLACDESIPSTTVEELAKTVAAFTSRFDSMENEIASLRLQLKQVKMMMNKSDVIMSTTTLSGPQESCDSSQFQHSANITYLSTLSNEQILHLLEFIGLPQYKSIFCCEEINGEIFVRLDDDALKNDLKITSSLHRARILTVISGQQSVSGLAGLLSGSYV